MSVFSVDTSKYLSRIGIQGPILADEGSLIRLTRAHLEAIPFENLEVSCQHHEPSLAGSDLFAKVVLSQRGGYCFELNKLFSLLLTQLGFDCISIPARVVHKRKEPRPISHRAILVRIAGKTWFCDVGFGGAGPKGALRFDLTAPQRVFGEEFLITPAEGIYQGEYTLSRLEDGAWDPVLVFKDVPWMEADFNTLNSYYATYPRSPFLLKRILYRCTPDGWISLVENAFTVCTESIRQTVELQTEQQIQEVIEQRFGVFL